MQYVPVVLLRNSSCMLIRLWSRYATVHGGDVFLFVCLWCVCMGVCGCGWVLHMRMCGVVLRGYACVDHVCRCGDCVLGLVLGVRVVWFGGCVLSTLR